MTLDLSLKEQADAENKARKSLVFYVVGATENSGRYFTSGFKAHDYCLEETSRMINAIINGKIVATYTPVQFKEYVLEEFIKK